MERVDVVVIGGGVLGAFAARHLRRWQLDTLLLEAEADVCMGISRANSAIVYSGCDNKPASRKARMTVHSNARFAALCKELDVPFQRCGSLMLSSGPRGRAQLEKKYAQGLAGGVPGLALLDRAQAQALEPLLPDTVTAALYAPTTGTVCPWQLTIAACENAQANGCRLMTSTEVVAIHRERDGYLLQTRGPDIRCRMVLNCAGLRAAQVQDMAFAPALRLQLDGADYCVLESARRPRHILFQELEEGKGVTIVPTVEGTLLIEGTARPLAASPWATTAPGLARLRDLSATLLPSLAEGQVLRSFAAVRPNPAAIGAPDRGLHDFIIAAPAPDFISLIGIKTPGLTCADALGAHLAERAAAYLRAASNPAFCPRRTAIHDDDGDIVCHCRQISRAAVQAAIDRGATTVDGVKHRLGTGAGHCQGSRCQARIEAMLEANRHDRH